MSSRPPRVLLTNDDGPPGPDSPYIYGLYRYLTKDRGWDVKVVIPSSQKSWIGKAYQIKDVISGRFYYPQGPDGLGTTSDHSRPLQDGETAEWILLDGTPATCTNIALHNLYSGQIDLLISGPNFGRNSSAAFSLSSGTVGAALSSALSRVRSIALSYGTVLRPTPKPLFEPAHRLSVGIINHLWENWGVDEGGLRNGEVDLYNVNIPMVEGLLTEEGLKICWTRIWRNSYGRLFKADTPRKAVAATATVAPGGPDSASASVPASQGDNQNINTKSIGELSFRWDPDMSDLIKRTPSSLPVGSDGWAIAMGWVSVTPLRASFAEPAGEWNSSTIDMEQQVWKVKL